jgi:hypothetical protein
MKQCILFGNCQCSGVRKFLEFSNFFDNYQIHQFANWELIKDENNMVIPVHLIQNADLVIYQPLSDVHNCYSTNRKNPDSFFSLLREDCKTVSFPRIHNNAIFPMFHKTARHDVLYGRIKNTAESIDEIIYLYNNNMIDYDFDARMSENYLISKEKESECDVKIADFIYNNISNHKLFLTHDHPTSFVFNEVTSQICDHLGFEYDYEKGATAEENLTEIEDSVYHSVDCQYPISRYAIQHFGFRYIQQETEEANLFYGSNTVEYFIRNQNT